MKEWLWKAGRTCSGANQKRVRPGSDTLGKRYSNMSQTTLGPFLWGDKHAHLKALSQSEKYNDQITNIRIQRQRAELIRKRSREALLIESAHI